MDTATRITQAENDLRDVERVLAHPVVAGLLEDNLEQQALARLFLENEELNSIEKVFAHIATQAHLRGLKRTSVLLQAVLEEKQTALEQAKQDGN